MSKSARKKSSKVRPVKRSSVRPPSTAHRSRLTVARAARRRTVASLPRLHSRARIKTKRRHRVVSADAPVQVPLRTIARRHVANLVEELGLTLKKAQVRTAIDRETRRLKMAKPEPYSSPEMPASLAALRDMGGTVSGVPGLDRPTERLEYFTGPHAQSSPAPTTPYTDATNTIASAIERLQRHAQRLVTKIDPVLMPSPAGASTGSGGNGINPASFILAFLEGARMQIVQVSDLLESANDRLVL